MPMSMPLTAHSTSYAVCGDPKMTTLGRSAKFFLLKYLPSGLTASGGSTPKSHSTPLLNPLHWKRSDAYSLAPCRGRSGDVELSRGRS